MPPKKNEEELELPKDKKLVETWRRLIDPARTSIKEFIEVYKVPTKKVTLLGGKSMVRFVERPAQSLQRQTIEDQWAEGTGGKEIGGKGRQEGWSTSASLLMWERFVRGGGGVANLFSYDDDAVKELFRLFQSFRRQTPAWVFTKLLRGGGEWLRASAKAMEIAFKDGGANAVLQCLTAGEKSSGSGSAPRWLLWDEFSKWKPEIKADPTAMSEGWMDAPGNVFIIQATGQGNEEFGKMFIDAFEGRGESGIKAIFMPWLGHPDRNAPLPRDEKQKQRFIDSIGAERGYGIKEERALVAAGATLEELRWRRQKISGPGFQYNVQLFSREYPLTPADLILSNTRTVFHGHEETLNSHVVPAQLREQRARHGEFVWKDDRPQFLEYPGGAWVLLEEPAEDLHYVYGADATSGKQVVNSQTSGEPDFAILMFDELVTGRTVARYRGHTEGRLLAEELFMGCNYYKGAQGRGALGYVENNTYGLAVIFRMNELEKGTIFGADLMLRAPSNMHSSAPHSGEEIGWATHAKSREILIDTVQTWLGEVGVYKPENGCKMCHQFVTEALLFERNPKTGKPEARRGHDDAVFAKALSLCARETVFREHLVDLMSKVNPKVPVDPFEEWHRGVMEQQRRELAVKGGSKYLGGAF